MAGEMTRLMMQTATKKSGSPRETAQELIQCASYRTTKDRLEKFANGRNLRAVLTEGLMADNPSRNEQSVDRNVRNWLRGDKDLDISRETAMELAFVLGLDIQDMNSLLASLTEEGLRWRDPDEIIMAFARMNGMSYKEAQDMKARLGKFSMKADRMPVNRENLTTAVRNKVTGLKTEEELKAYLISSEVELGVMHNTAYVLFRRFMDILEAPKQPEGVEDMTERRMSVREILQVYLFRNLVPVAGRRKKEEAPNLSAQQKAILTRIKAGWPDESTLSKMKSREIDVNRKVLVLLFLATDGGGMQFSKKQYDPGRTISQETVFKESMTRLNRMLGGCGYSLLDPRSPFDWIVLYCLCVDSVWETDEKMASILTELFVGNQNQD